MCDASPRRLAEAARNSKAVEEDISHRKDLEVEIARLNGELQKVWEIPRARVILHQAELLIGWIRGFRALLGGAALEQNVVRLNDSNSLRPLVHSYRG